MPHPDQVNAPKPKHPLKLTLTLILSRRLTLMPGRRRLTLTLGSPLSHPTARTPGRPIRH